MVYPVPSAIAPTSGPFLIGRGVAGACLPLLASLAVGACGSSQASRVTPTYHDKTGQLSRLDYDSRGTGRNNIHVVMEGSRPVRAEVDADGDGTIDRWEYYGPHGEVEKVGAASKHDGHEDTWIHPAEDGRIGEVERLLVGEGESTRHERYSDSTLLGAVDDRNGDGKPDRWEHYEDGALVSLEVDTTLSRGVPDRRLRYSTAGTLLGVEELTDAVPPASAPQATR